VPDIKQTTSEAGTDSAFFDIRVLNPLAPSNWNHTLTSCYRRNEQEKRRAYDQRVREIEHRNFTPLVFSASGRMGPAARVFYEKLVSMIAIKHNKAYSKTLNWMRCRISFSLLRLAVMCLRGSRSSRGRPTLPVVGEGILNLHSLKDVSDSKSLSQTSPIFLRSLACQLILFVLVYSFILYEIIFV